METIGLISIGIIIGAVIVYLLLRKRFSGVDDLSDILKSQVNEIFPDALSKANKQLIDLADQKLKAEKQDIQTDLKNKKTAIEDLVRIIRQDLEKTSRRVEMNEKDRIGSFKALSEKVEEVNRLNKDLSKSTKDLQELLSNNQLRGQFGEQVAENLLKMAGFVRGVDYEFNKEQKETETRPDFAIFLPDGTRINVDAKFPYKNLQRMVEAADDQKELRKKLLDEFKRDVKKKIQQVTSRDYIDPEAKTVDFVILFIPNEMIFSYIYDKLNDIWEEGMKKKVIMAGPFNFTAILRLIKQAYDNFKIQKDAQKIIGYIRTFEKEFSKYNEEFEKIGDRIVSLTTQYEKVDKTRTNQLMKAVSRVQLEDSLPEKEDLETKAIQEE